MIILALLAMVDGMNSKLGHIAAPGQIDVDGMGLRAFLVELADAFADLVGGYAHDGIVAGVVVVGAVEDLDADDPFLELVEIARESFPHHVAQKTLAAVAMGEGWRGQN